MMHAMPLILHRVASVHITVRSGVASLWALCGRLQSRVTHSRCSAAVPVCG